MKIKRAIKTIKHPLKLMLFFWFTFLISSCSSDDNNEIEEPKETRLTSGFVIRAFTPNNNSIVKYFEDIPTGVADLTDGQIFPEFSVSSVFKGFLYGQPTDTSNGAYAKYGVDENGKIVEEGRFSTQGQRSTLIHVVDETTGVFYDEANKSTIGIFNPETFQIDGSIDMSAGAPPADAEPRLFITRGDEVFSVLFGGELESLYVQSANYKTGQYLGTTTFPGQKAVSIGLWGNNLVDEQGNIYILDGGLPSRDPATLSVNILKIPAGSTQFDPGYVFNPALTINQQNLVMPFVSNFTYIGNNRALAHVATKTPQEALAIIIGAGGFANLTPEQFQQIVGILQTADDTGNWVELNLVDKTATIIEGIPAQRAFNPSFVELINDEYYLYVGNSTTNAVYKYNPETRVAEKAFDIVGGSGSSIRMYDISKNK